MINEVENENQKEKIKKSICSIKQREEIFTLQELLKRQPLRNKQKECPLKVISPLRMFWFVG